MNREQLILKWLDYDLSPEELKVFKRLEDYDEIIRLNGYIDGFKADLLNEEDNFKTILKSVEFTQKKSKKSYGAFLKIAAILCVSFGIYMFSNSIDNVTQTLASEYKTVILPDESRVELNAASSITFNDSDWKNSRSLNLEGEAFFKVAKGQKFDVHTVSGKISVLGTEFNVKQRNNYFEVTCYEGKVHVNSIQKQITLLPGESFLTIDGKYIATEKENLLSPSWLNKESTFKSIPYREVIAELERQYSVSVQLDSTYNNEKFTGSFRHDDLDNALKSISLPLQLKYSKLDNIIKLERE